MYSAQIKIGGSFAQLNNVDLSELNIVRYRDDDTVRVRDKATGKITLYGSDYELLKGLGEDSVELRILFKDIVIFQGSMFLLGTDYENEAKLELSVETQDNYTILKKNIDRKRMPEHVQNVLIDAHTWLDTHTQGMEKNGATIPPEDYKFCNSYNPGELGSYDNEKQYISAVLLSGDEQNENRVWHGSFQDSFVKYQSKGWVCLQDCMGITPQVGSPYWARIFEVVDYGQERGGYRWDGSEWNEQGRYFFMPNCSTRVIKVKLLGVDLAESLQTHLSKYGYDMPISQFLPYISQNFYERKDLVLIFLQDNVNVKPLSLKEYISVYEFLFNVSWKLDGDRFYFVHPSEIPVELPSPMVAEHNISSLYGGNFSMDQFTWESQDAVGSEKIMADDTIKDEYSPVYIDYDVPFESTRDIRFDLAVLDYTQIDNPEGPSKDKLIVAFDRNTLLVNNDALSLIELVKDHYTIDRPFTNAQIRGSAYTFEKRYSKTCTISAPIARHDMIDFNYLIKTDHGNLRVNEVSLNLANASVTIKAAKQ